MHPNNKLQRRKIRDAKFKTNEEKRKEAKDRSGAVWRKLSKEHLREQETQDELKEVREAYSETERKN